MLKPIDVILFATDLTHGCNQAYEFAVAMAIRNKAILYILYIIPDIPEGIESRLKTLVGRHKWQGLMEMKREDIHKSLTGKRTSSEVLAEIQSFCEKVGMDEDSCAFHSREIIISAGDVAETIIENAEKNECDIIVMGMHHGLISRNTIGDSIKTVPNPELHPVINTVFLVMLILHELYLWSSMRKAYCSFPVCLKMRTVSPSPEGICQPIMMWTITHGFASMNTQNYSLLAQSYNILRDDVLNLMSHVMVLRNRRTECETEQNSCKSS